MRLRLTLTASIGSAIEYYDFMIFGYFSQILGEQFFPMSSSIAQNLYVTGIFAAGYLVRPIGSIIFGHIGDTHGRSKSIFYTLSCGMIAITWVVITPTYAQVGPIASVLFILARIIQGITTGGNVMGTITYVSEISPIKNRAFSLSTVWLGINRGMLFALIVSTLLSKYLSKEQLFSWGWRAGFGVGLISLILVTIYTKQHMHETRHHIELNKQEITQKSPFRILFSQHKLAIISGIGITSLAALLLTLLVFYLPIYLRYYKVPNNIETRIYLALILVFAFTIQLFGWIGDKVGVRKVLILACCLVILTANYCYQGLINGNTFQIYASTIILGTTFAAVLATVPALLVGMFPTRVRYSGVSIAYNTCCSIFSGLTPFIITLLQYHVHSNKNTVVILVVICTTISLLSTVFLNPENDYLWRKELKWQNALDSQEFNSSQRIDK